MLNSEEARILRSVLFRERQQVDVAFCTMKGLKLPIFIFTALMFSGKNKYNRYIVNDKLLV